MLQALTIRLGLIILPLEYLENTLDDIKEKSK
jgi:hypothetical protein